LTKEAANETGVWSNVQKSVKYKGRVAAAAAAAFNR